MSNPVRSDVVLALFRRRQDLSFRDLSSLYRSNSSGSFSCMVCTFRFRFCQYIFVHSVKLLFSCGGFEHSSDLCNSVETRQIYDQYHVQEKKVGEKVSEKECRLPEGLSTAIAVNESEQCWSLWKNESSIKASSWECIKDTVKSKKRSKICVLSISEIFPTCWGYVRIFFCTKEWRWGSAETHETIQKMHSQIRYSRRSRGWQDSRIPSPTFDLSFLSSTRRRAANFQISRFVGWCKINFDPDVFRGLHEDGIWEVVHGARRNYLS